MDRIAAALQAVEDQSSDGAPVTLLAHSAGGWLSRVFLLEVSILCSPSVDDAWSLISRMNIASDALRLQFITPASCAHSLPNDSCLLAGTVEFDAALQEGVGRVDRLVSLGSPHNPPPPGVIDQTRGILSHVAATSPGNFHEQVFMA